MLAARLSFAYNLLSAATGAQLSSTTGSTDSTSRFNLGGLKIYSVGSRCGSRLTSDFEHQHRQVNEHCNPGQGFDAEGHRGILNSYP